MSEVLAVIDKLKEIEMRNKKLNDFNMVQTKGTALLSDLKKLRPILKEAQKQFPQVIQSSVEAYIRLNKEIADKINTYIKARYKDTFDSYLEQSKPAAEDVLSRQLSITSALKDDRFFFCAHCKEDLSDRTIEALGVFFHFHCFSCTKCKLPLAMSCLNIDGKPFCGFCGRTHYRDNKGGLQFNPEY